MERFIFSFVSAIYAANASGEVLTGSGSAFFDRQYLWVVVYMAIFR